MSELDRIREVDAMMVDITGKSLSLEELEAIARKISQIESESFDRGVLKEQSLQRAILEEVRSIGIQQGYTIGYEEGKRDGYESGLSDGCSNGIADDMLSGDN